MKRIKKGGMKRMSRTGIRLTEEERKDLEQLSNETDLKMSDLIRRAVVALIKQCKKKGGKIQLPFKFEEDN